MKVVDMPALQSLISLDLAHNSFESSTRLAGQLAPLEALRQLSVVGNPLCLLSGYQRDFVARLRGLQTLDAKPVTTFVSELVGQASSTGKDGSTLEADGSSKIGTPACRLAQLSITALQVDEDQLDAAVPEPPADGAAQPGLPEPPHKPDLFYVELATHEGVDVASMAKRLAPPPEPEAAPKGEPHVLTVGRGTPCFNAGCVGTTCDPMS